jgi:hypothetical protein
MSSVGESLNVGTSPELSSRFQNSALSFDHAVSKKSVTTLSAERPPQLNGLPRYFGRSGVQIHLGNNLIICFHRVRQALHLSPLMLLDSACVDARSHYNASRAF